MVTKTLNELAVEIAVQKENLLAAEKAKSEAETTVCAIRNHINNLQKDFDIAINDVTKNPPKFTHWDR